MQCEVTGEAELLQFAMEKDCSCFSQEGSPYLYFLEYKERLFRCKLLE